MLDTLDARFQNRSTQVGNNLWNVHTVGPGLPTPRLYRINTGASPPTQLNATFFASPLSSDFNPSITARFDNAIAVTWSSTNAGAGINAQVRVGACASGAGICSPGSGALVFQSTGPLLGNFSGFDNLQRWGDYSSIAIDPTNGNIAWGVNEAIDNPDQVIVGDSWGSRFFSASIP